MVSIVATPPSPSPGYNPLVTYLDSTNKNQPAFRYIIQIFPQGSANLLTEFKIAPRPGDGYGYVDISKIVSTQLSSNIDFFSTGVYDADQGTIFNYDLKFGEEYIDTWAFSDYQYCNTTGFIGLTDLTNFSLTPHGYSVGDQVAVTLTTVYNNFRDNLNGFFTVVDVPNAYTITVDLAFIGNGPVTPGTVQYADGRKTRATNQANSLDQIAFNRAYGFEAFHVYDQNTVLPDNPMSEIQTSAPDTGFRCKLYQYLWWNFYDGETNTIDEIWFENSLGEQFYKTAGGLGNVYMKCAAVGPANHGPLTPVGAATLPLIKPGVEWYEVYGVNNAASPSVPSTNPKRIEIDRRCSINQHQLLFLDRAGSWSSFSFSLRARESQATTRTTFRKEYGDQNGGPTANVWGYRTWDAGETTFWVEQATSWQLNSDFLSNEMSSYFRELVSSPEVYLLLESGLNETPPTWRRVHITDSNYEIQSTKNKKLIRNVVNLKLAVDDSINI